MRIPDTLVVGGMVYAVRRVERIVDSRGDVMGRFDPRTGVIELAPGTSEAVEATFLHELVHALHWHTGAALRTCPPEEDEVDALANALHMVLRANPGLLAPEEALGPDGFLHGAFMEPQPRGPGTRAPYSYEGVRVDHRAPAGPDCEDAATARSTCGGSEWATSMA